MADEPPYNLRPTIKPSQRLIDSLETQQQVDNLLDMTDTSTPNESSTLTDGDGTDCDDCPPLTSAGGHSKQDTPTMTSPPPLSTGLPLHTYEQPLASPTSTEPALSRLQSPVRSPTPPTPALMPDFQQQLLAMMENMNGKLESVKCQNDEMKCQNDEMRENMKCQNADMKENMDMQLGHINFTLMRNKEDLEKDIKGLKTEMTGMVEKIKQELRQDLQIEIELVKAEVKENLDLVKKDQGGLLENIQMLKEGHNALSSKVNNIQQATSYHLETLKEATNLKIQQNEEKITALQAEQKEVVNVTRDQECYEAVRRLNDDITEQESRLKRLELNRQGAPQFAAVPEIHVTCTGGGLIGDSTIPRFTGRAHNPCEFLARLEKYYLRQVNRGGPGKRCELETLHETVESSLDQHASRWWQLSRGDVKSWSDFHTLFTEKYWSREVQKAIRQRLETERYRPDGRLTRSEYFIERVLTLRSMTPTLSEDEIVTTLSEHYGDMVKDARRVQNVDTVRDFEALLQREDLQETRNRPPEASRQSYPRDNRATNNNDGNWRPRNDKYFPSSREVYRVPEQRPQPHRTPEYRQQPYPPRQPYNQQRYQPRDQPRDQRDYQNQRNQPPRYGQNNEQQRNFPNQQRNRYQPYPKEGGEQYRSQPYPTKEQANVCQIIAEPEPPNTSAVQHVRRAPSPPAEN